MSDQRDLHEPAGPLLDVHGIDVSYERRRNGKTVLADFTFHVAHGEAVGVIGESGSGKTTLAKVVLGTVPVRSGSVSFDGQELGGMSPRARKAFRRTGAIQYVFQDPLGSLDPEWTAYRSVEEALLLQGVTDAKAIDRRVREAFEHVRLPPDLLARRPAKLSGGQRQRVAIARALVSHPRLLIADEPVSALDASARAHVLELFSDLRSRMNIAQIFISHDLGSVAGLVDRIAVLHRGRIVESGPPEQIIGDPRHDYTRELIRAAPRLVRI